MNEQELHEYRMNKFKDGLLTAYTTFLGIAAFMALFVLSC